jgi:hypothetical protein
MALHDRAANGEQRYQYVDINRLRERAGEKPNRGRPGMAGNQERRAGAQPEDMTANTGGSIAAYMEPEFGQ